MNIKVTIIVKVGEPNKTSINQLIKNKKTDKIILKKKILFTYMTNNSICYASSRVM